MTLDGIAGRLSLRPGDAPAVVCTRPMVGADMMRRLTEGRRATLLPDLVAAVFTLCAVAQRATSRRAVRAAFDLHDSAGDAARDALVLALVTAREHLQRFAIDMPTLAPQPGVAPDAAWLRDAPVMALPAVLTGPGEAALHAAAAALPGWLERRFFGLPPSRWLAQWEEAGDAWLSEWAASHEHPFTRWLRSAAPAARAFALPCRPLRLAGAAGARELAASLAGDAAFAERPLWQGAPAETGPWTRAGREQPVATLWDRLGARVADLATIALHAHESPLAAGALQVAAGEGIAWSEMSRGLLVHWVRIEDGPREPDVARAAVYRVVAPTEWNFHPEGALAQALARDAAAPARLAAAALDPCLVFDVEEPRHA